MNNQAFDNLIKLGRLKLKADGDYKMSFSILNTSEVFKGHFPEQPILPGVVMIELTKRAAELAIERKIKLVSAANFKFLKMVDPNVIDEAEMLFSVSDTDGGWRVKGCIIFKDEIYFKADACYEQH